MPASTFTLGQLVRMTVTFTQNSTFVDPGSVTLIIDENDTVPNSTITASSSIIHPSTGTYYYDYDADTPGQIEYRWKSTGPQGAKENYFVVEASRVDTP